MADNVIASSTDGLGVTFATDDATGVHWPYAKLAWGADNTQTPVASGAAAVPIQDGGNTITIDGTVTANLGATDNAVLDLIDAQTSDAAALLATIDTDTSSLAGAVSGTTIKVTVENTTTVSGTVTANLSATDNAVLDEIEAATSAGTVLLGTIDADTGSLAGAVSGTTIKVTVENTPATTVTGTVDLGATDNAVLDSIAASVSGTLTVGSHAVTNAGTFAVQEDGAALTALQLIDDAVIAVDAAVGTTKTVLGGAIRDDALSSLTPIEGDATYLRVDANGALWAILNGSLPDTAAGDLAAINTAVSGTLTVGSHAVTNAGTFAVQVDGSALTALQLIDDAVFADDAAFTLASSKTMVSGAIRDDALSALTAVEGDVVPLRVSSTGALHVTGGGGGTQYNIDDAGGATDTGTVLLAIRDDSLTTLTPVDGDYVGLRVNSTGALHVTGGGGGTEYAVDDALGATPTGTVPLAIRDDALSALTPVEGDAIALRVSSTGALWTEDVNSAAILADTANMDTNLGTIAGDTTSIDGKITACNTGAVVISSGTVTTVSTVTNLAQMGGVAISLNTGVRDAGTQRVTIATDDSVPVTHGALTELAAAINTNRLDINLDSTPAANLATLAAAVSTEFQCDIVGALPAGTNAIGKLAANSGVDIGDVDVTSISAGSNLIGDVGISGARTSGGTTLYKNIDVDESEDQVKGTAGQVYWIHAINLKATPLYLKFYNATAASVTVGTTTPDLTFPVPSQGDTNGAGFTLSIPNGIAFSTAITIAATTGVADNDSGAPGANELIVNLGYA